jgi:glycosyltransferase involved in cell wall biosynthesis
MANWLDPACRTDLEVDSKHMSQPAPQFSVIIPAYNSARTLAKAIESVLEQTYPAREVIVIDDGSTDNTAQLVNGYTGKVSFIRQSNAGVSAARNRGAECASGDWLAFLDADDWYYPDRLRLHADMIMRDPGLDFLTGDYEYRDEHGKLIGTSMTQHASGQAMLGRAGESAVVVMESEDIESFVADHFGDIHTLSVPRDVFEKLGGYPPGFKVCEDVHFLTRLCAISNRVGVVCRPMAVYTIHGSSATRSDPLKAQQYNVQTLLDLKRLACTFPAPVQRGVMARLRTGRLNLGYALVKSGKRLDAINAVLPSCLETPGWASIRNVFSMLKG